MLNILIKTTADASQRYNTVGDYYTTDDGTRVFTVSDMGDERLEFLTALHELVESMLCQQRGITDAAIDAFDFAFENARPSGDGLSEPGDDPHAPYYREHQFATKLEKLMASELGVDWDEYTEVCRRLTLK